MVLYPRTNKSVSGVIGGNATFSSPHSVVFFSGTLLVADRGYNAIKLFAAPTWSQVGAVVCPAPWTPWAVRVDYLRGVLFVADGTNNMLWVLNATVVLGGVCDVLQRIDVGNNTVPHEMGVDVAAGDLYLAGIGSVPTLQRNRPIPTSDADTKPDDAPSNNRALWIGLVVAAVLVLLLVAVAIVRIFRPGEIPGKEMPRKFFTL